MIIQQGRFLLTLQKIWGFIPQTYLFCVGVKLYGVWASSLVGVYSVEVCGVLLRQWSVLVVDLMSVEFRIKVTLESCFPVGVQRLPESSALFKKDKHRKKHTPSFPLSPTRRYLVLYPVTLTFYASKSDRWTEMCLSFPNPPQFFCTCNRIINSRTFSRSLSVCQSKFERSVALSRRPPLTFSSVQLRFVLFLQCLQKGWCLAALTPHWLHVVYRHTLIR